MRATRAGLLALLMSLTLPVAALASAFDEGLAAYERGDYAAALSLWLPLAEKGDAHAQANVALLYLRGDGVAQDREAAARWYRRAAERGNTVAQDNLGVMYHRGHGVDQDDAKAAYWIGRAARAGDPAAQLHLGQLYAEGLGVAQDDAEAAHWWKEAAEQGESVAQANLGFLHRAGRGVPQDDVEAYIWLHLAAEQGVERAAAERDRLVGELTPEQRARADLRADQRARLVRRPPEARVSPSDLQVASKLPTLGPVPPTPEPAPPPVAAAPAPPPAPRPAGPTRVQLASLRSASDARHEWARLQRAYADLLGGRELHLQQVVLADSTYYRVQTGGFPDAADAGAFCASLRARGQACLIVTPR